MGDIEIGELEPVPIREVWPHEARDLTPWLAERPELIGEAVGMDLDTEGREVPVGSYSADLMLNDLNSDSRVVVEIMYGATDHDHIGKLITYAAGLEADYAMLLAEDFRPEHRAAITWLNSISAEDSGFFGLVLEVWHIGTSPPAPRLRVVVQPDDWVKSVRAAENRRSAGLESRYRRFWEGMLLKLHGAHPQWSGKKKPGTRHFMQFKSAHPNVKYATVFIQCEERPLTVRANILVKGDRDATASLYNEIQSKRDDIEAKFGEELDWEPSARANQHYHYIETRYPQPMLEDEEKWPEAWDWLVYNLGKLSAAIDPVIEKITENP